MGGSQQSPVTGRIFDIKPFAVHDGPGIRTTVFMKGCSLRCAWCHNPEAISPKPEIAFYPQHCIACGACVEACPQGAQSLTDDGLRALDRRLCVACGGCVDVCYAEALQFHGRTVTVDEVMVDVARDARFYAKSGGGVTVSGGEPLLQVDFVAELLARCREAGYHTAVDTCGQVPWSSIEAVLPFTDVFLYDLKHISPARHRDLTGADNDRILLNLRRLSASGAAIEIRIPVVPGFNDDPISIGGMADVLKRCDSVTGIRLLPYHRLAGSKYDSIGRSNTMPDVETPGPDDLKRVADWLKPAGHPVVVSGDPTGADADQATEGKAATL